MATTALIDLKALKAVNAPLAAAFAAEIKQQSTHQQRRREEAKGDERKAAAATRPSVGAGAGAGAGVGAGAGAGAGDAAARTKHGGRKRPRRMSGVKPRVMHGALAKKEWRAPLLVTYCDKEARPGYNSMKAHEYNDDAETLRGKIKVLAELIRKSKHCVAYTGAGISTASGINDYASKAKDSVATGSRAKRAPKKTSGLYAEPTFSHYALTALFRNGMLKHWVQQNHDGLPQKAGYPQEHLNEIHGAWHAPDNPVVPMTGTLRDDLCEWMEEEEEKADLVLAMGTSLCGMNADRMVETPSAKMAKGKALGAVIVGLQRTQMDDGCALRLFAKIDDVMLLLALEMGLRVPLQRYKLVVPKASRVAGTQHTFMVPYDSAGRRASTLHKWTLELGTRVHVTGGPGKGFLGTVAHVPKDGTGFYKIQLPIQREGSKNHGTGARLYSMGAWWVDAAIRAAVPSLPVAKRYPHEER